jgi:drug/metabolite transporter (DMT)-like permease
MNLRVAIAVTAAIQALLLALVALLMYISSRVLWSVAIREGGAALAQSSNAVFWLVLPFSALLAFVLVRRLGQLRHRWVATCAGE